MEKIGAGRDLPLHIGPSGLEGLYQKEIRVPYLY